MIKIGFNEYDEDDFEARIFDIIFGLAELSDDPDLYADLYAEYMNEMPYGTAKARDGDPDEWLFEKLCQDFAYLGI